MNYLIKKINDKLKESENTDLSEEEHWGKTLSEEKPWGRIKTYYHWLLDILPYGWRLHYKCFDIKRWCISRYQQIRYGVSNEECWNMDCTFTKFILPRLKHFKKMKRYGYPPSITPEKWEEIIDELIWTFEYMLDTDQFNPMPLFKREGISIDDYVSYVKKERTPAEDLAWQGYVEHSRKLEERRKEGMQLFANYYVYLWD